MSIKTTEGGHLFIQKSLEDNEKILTLPGLDSRQNTNKLKKTAFTSNTAILGLYIAFNCDRNMFVAYMKELNIILDDANKKILCDTLDAKWQIVSDF